MRDQADKVASGDLGMAARMLTAQAIALDNMFTELARRSTLNMREYIDAADRYARLALKAQSNCRATLEALAKLHQPREQTVRHIHVGQGAQAVVAEQFHHHHAGVRKCSFSRTMPCNRSAWRKLRVALPGRARGCPANLRRYQGSDGVGCTGAIIPVRQRPSLKWTRKRK